MKNSLFHSVALLALSGSFVIGAPAQAAGTAANPFAIASTLPFQAPRFDLIEDADYQPAFEQGIAEQRAEMQRIANDPAAPTFDNTIVAMEQSGRMLDRVSETFFGVVQANTNATLDKVQEVESPKLSQNQDAIYLDARLFARVQSIYAKRATLKLTAEQRQLLEIYRQQFIHAGAQLSDAEKTKLKDLNTRISTLETSYQQKLLAAAKAGGLVVDDKAKLAGLDAGAIDAAAQAAKDRKLDGKWVIPLQNTTQQPALESMTDRATREQLFQSSWTRAEKGDANDTRETIAQLAQLRAQKAAILGYPNWAAYILSDQMAKTPEIAKAFMMQLVPATAPSRSAKWPRSSR